MKKWFKNHWVALLVVFLVLCLVGLLILQAWAFITYKDVPLKDVPFWVSWLLGRI